MGSKLHVDVYIAPAIPAKTGYAEEHKSVWSPISCVLVHGPNSAALIDAPTTIEQGEAISKWIADTIPGKKLEYIYTTHAHPDHFHAVPVIEKHFPGVQFVATQNVTNGIKQLYETSYEFIWPRFFPGQLSSVKPVPKPLSPSGEFFLDGEKLQGIDVGHADNEYSTFLHVPSVGLIVSGDIIYGDCHQHFGEANTPAKRREWLDAIDRIESLAPHIVIAGHKRATQADGPYLIQSTREYIFAFERELTKAKSSQELYDRMVELYPQRWNHFILAFGCDESFKARESRL